MVQIGILTSGINTKFPIIVNGVTKATSADIKEVKDEDGKVAFFKATSIGYTISITGTHKVTAGVEIPVAGDSVEIDGITYIIESVDVTESNEDFMTLSISAKTADDAVIID